MALTLLPVGVCVSVTVLQHFAHGRVDLAISLIGPLENCHIRLVRPDLMSDLNTCGAGFLDGSPMACSNSGQDRRPVRSSLFRLQHFDCASIYIGLNLPPQA